MVSNGSAYSKVAMATQVGGGGSPPLHSVSGAAGGSGIARAGATVVFKAPRRSGVGAAATNGADDRVGLPAAVWQGASAPTTTPPRSTRTVGGRETVVGDEGVIEAVVDHIACRHESIWRGAPVVAPTTVRAAVMRAGSRTGMRGLRTPGGAVKTGAPVRVPVVGAVPAFGFSPSPSSSFPQAAAAGVDALTCVEQGMPVDRATLLELATSTEQVTLTEQDVYEFVDAMGGAPDWADDGDDEDSGIDESDVDDVTDEDEEEEQAEFERAASALIARLGAAHRQVVQVGGLLKQTAAENKVMRDLLPRLQHSPNDVAVNITGHAEHHHQSPTL